MGKTVKGKNNHLPPKRVCKRCGAFRKCYLLAGAWLCYDCYCPDYPATYHHTGFSNLCGGELYSNRKGGA